MLVRLVRQRKLLRKEFVMVRITRGFRKGMIRSDKMRVHLPLSDSPTESKYYFHKPKMFTILCI